jgi:LuxR family maltose regulon positive regulatory protein
VIAALRTVAPGVGESALSLLQASQPAPVETVLTVLLNDLGTMAADIVLVLDDYHVIDAREIQDEMAFLIDRLPAGLHVVIASRADPAFPLARLRARGELVEIRAAELRFTPDEAAAYLNEMMGLQLTARDVAALEGRTEGWIAALQLAALSIQGRDDVAGFIAGFAGDDRYVVDYLVEEVLQRQPGQVQAFLLQTSVLGRLSGPLCDAVTGQGGGKAMLEVLDRGNLFLVPLDDRRQWYRYHHLFADVLQARLLDEQPGEVPGLHRRASAWYQQNGEQSVAIGHALAARDFGQAADLIERALPAMRETRQEATVHRWLKVLPDEVVLVRPMLCFAMAGALLETGELEGVEVRLRDAERWLGEATATSKGSPAPPAEMVVANEEEFRRLPGAIELYRSALAMARGDLPATVRYARRTLDRALADDHGVRAGASGFLGLAFWTSGDLEAGHSAWAECAAGLRRSGQIADIFGCAIGMADIRLAQGRLGEAMRTYEQALRRASEQDGPVLRGTADMYVGMSEVHREYDDLQAATQQLLRSQELGEAVGLPQNRYRWRVAMARIRQAEGDPGGALDLLNEAEAYMWATSSRTYGRSRRCGQEPGSRRADSVKRSAGRVSMACPLMTTSVTCASSSTSRWPGCSWRGTPMSAPSTPLTRRPGSWSASCGQRKQGGGRDASSRSWYCGRSRTRCGRTSRLRWPAWNGHWRWLSRRVTSASSSMRDRRWLPC